MSLAFSLGSRPSSALARAQAFLRTPRALIISLGRVSRPAPALKWCSERSVCAPQYLSAATAISPIVSFSVRLRSFARVAIFVLLSGFLRVHPLHVLGGQPALDTFLED